MTRIRIIQSLAFLWSINQWTAVSTENRKDVLSIERILGEKQYDDRNVPQYVVRIRKTGELIKFNTKWCDKPVSNSPIL